MTKGIVMALIIGAAILAAVGAMIWFSPYQTCVRDMTGYRGTTNGQPLSAQSAERFCATHR